MWNLPIWSITRIRICIFCTVYHLMYSVINSVLWILHLIQALCCLQEQSPILGWAPQPSAPNCLVSHLTFARFEGFEGFPDEMSFVEYLLQKGLVLETMIIDVRYLDLEKKYSILKKLLNLRRGSGMCQLTFDWAVSPKVWFLSLNPFTLPYDNIKWKMTNFGFSQPY